MFLYWWLLPCPWLFWSSPRLSNFPDSHAAVVGSPHVCIVVRMMHSLKHHRWKFRSWIVRLLILFLVSSEVWKKEEVEGQLGFCQISGQYFWSLGGWHRFPCCCDLVRDGALLCCCCLTPQKQFSSYLVNYTSTVLLRLPVSNEWVSCFVEEKSA